MDCLLELFLLAEAGAVWEGVGAVSLRPVPPQLQLLIVNGLGRSHHVLQCLENKNKIKFFRVYA